MENNLLNLLACLTVESGRLIEMLSRKYYRQEYGKLSDFERRAFEDLQKQLKNFLEEDDGK